MAAQLLATPAAAQEASHDPALAEALFREGKDLMDAGKYAEACPKLRESQRLDPAPGTLLRLARCHELGGQTASAWAEYGEGLAVARKDGRADRIQFAQEGIDRVEPLLSRLKVVVPDAVAAIKGLRIELDGMEIRRPAWGTAAPVDPGPHTIKAVAPGRRDVLLEVEIGAAKDVKEVAIPALEVQPSDLAPESPESPAAESTPHRLPAYLAGGVGVVSIGVGSYFGLRAMSKRDDAVSACPTSQCTIPSAVDANDDAKKSAWISNVGFGVGLVALGVGTYLYLSPPKSAPTQGASPPRRTVAIIPSVTDRSGGVALGGTW